MRILLCEDNPLIAMDMQWVLSDLGHVVEGIVTTAKACRKRVVRQPPDLVFVDFNLADGRTGLGLVEDLTQMGLPSIIVSGEAKLVPPTSSARAVLMKPFSDRQLAYAIREVGTTERGSPF